jgi:anti-sigma factor RsiW
MMTHPTEETLNDYLERELTPAEHVRVATHLETCADCAVFVAELQQIVRDASALGPIEPPEHVWTAIKSTVASRQSSVDSREPKAQGPKPNVHSLWPRYAWALATAALVVMAFFTGRMAQQREQQDASQQEAATTAGRASVDDTAVRERVLLIAVGDHLERSQMVLVELAHAETRGELDISAERQLADDLVASNRLYRQTAQQMGQENVAGLLDELERVLVEVARGPSTVSMGQLADIQQRIEALGIVFKVKVVGSDIRQQPVS